MKKRIITTILAVTMIMSLVGCGAKEETFEHIEETTAVEETVETETAQETEVEVETVEETLEVVEETEVVEAEPVTFERENITMTACVTNLGRGGEFRDKYMIGNSTDTYSSNDFLDIEVMSELENRGYDISDIIVTWHVAVNEDGESEWAVYGKDTYGKVDDSGEHFVKLHPVIIKKNNIDDSKQVYNYYLDDVYHGNADGNADAWYAVAQATKDMKADENYEEIDFNIPENSWTEYYQSYIDETYATSESVCENITINDWYNGLIYAMFVSETVDLDGYFHVIML